MSKYIRNQPNVSRQIDENIDGNHWLKQFEKTLLKSAVQPKRVDQSMFDQINAIMNSKSKYTSVEAAVEEMKSRSGLTDYLKKINKTSTENEDKNKKTASSNIHLDVNAKDVDMFFTEKMDLSAIPELLKEKPEIKNTLQNYIEETKGHLPIPAIIDKIRTIHQKDVGNPKYWDDPKLIALVSKLNLHAKKNNPEVFDNYSNLGKRDHSNGTDIDQSNTDMFASLSPVKF